MNSTLAVVRHVACALSRSANSRDRLPRRQVFGFFCLVLICSVATEKYGYCQVASSSDSTEVSPKDFPIPKGAKGRVVDQEKQEIRFQTETPIETTAVFFQNEMKKLQWEPTFEQVASIFANLYYRKSGKTMKVKLKKANIFKSTVNVTILGDGIAWNNAAKTPVTPGKSPSAESQSPEERQQKKVMAKAVPSVVGIKSSDFPLLNTQQTSSRWFRAN